MNDDTAVVRHNEAVSRANVEIDCSIEELYLPVVEDNSVVDKYVVFAVIGVVFVVVVVVVVVVVMVVVEVVLVVVVVTVLVTMSPLVILTSLISLPLSLFTEILLGNLGDP